MSEKTISENAPDYSDTINEVCELLQTATTPEAIKDLIDGFNKLSDALTHGPFLEVFEAILTNISFSALFSLLAAPDNRLIVSVVNLTQKLLEPVTWDMIHEKFENFIVMGLEHPHPKVKMLVLSQILRANLLTDKFSSSYSPAIWECLIGDTSSDHVNLSLNVLMHLSAYSNSIEFIYTEASLAVINDILAMDSSHRFRVYDIVSNTVINSEKSVFYLEKSKILSKFIAEFKSNDPLTIMNALELLPKMASNKHFFDYMVSEHILDLVSDFMKTGEIDGVQFEFVRSFALKTFCRFIDSKGLDFYALCSQYSLINVLIQYLEQSADTTLRVTTISCLGIVTTDPEFLKHLYKECKLLDIFLEILQGSTGDVKLESLRTFSCILDKSSPIDREISEINHILFKRLYDGDFLSALLKICRSKFEEETVASLSVIQKVSLYTWGHKELSQSQTFLNFLVEKSEFSSISQEWKFSIITSISSNEEFLAMIPDPYAGKIVAIATDGSNMSHDAVPAVATQSL